VYVCVSRSPEDIGIWISSLRKEDCPHQCRWVSSNPLRSWIEQKGRGTVNSFSLLELRYPSLVIGHQCSRFFGFWTHTGTYIICPPRPAAAPSPRPLDSDWITTLALLFLQYVESRSQKFSTSITARTTSYNKSHIYIYVHVSMYLYLHSLGSLSRESWVIRRRW